jgi:glycine cleavage system regulatory protein
MKVSLVLTIIGPDRPGIVESLARKATAHDANWEESRMARLAGQFAGILRVSVPDHEAGPLGDALRELEGQGLRVVIEKIAAIEGTEARRPLRLELVGNDRPGIVREISQVLASHGVNVDELQTECANAPMSGQVLFRASARLGLPADLSLDELQERLERIAGDLMVDLSIEEPAAT